jgi:dihydropteroate synthase
MILRARHFEFSFPRPVMLMGVVNVTPDSFSDGGKFLEPKAAIDHAIKLVEEGAEILDIGGESTRPNATPVPESEELQRVLPVLKGLGAVTVPISIDTQKPGVARAAIAAGASIINDIGANRTDPEMWRVAAETGAAYVAMHMLGTPQTMQLEPNYRNVVAEVESFFEDRLSRMTAAGLRTEQIIFDPGIGFGKTLEHNLELLAKLKAFRKLARPTLLGVSRKSFISKLLNVELGARLPGALACACWAVEAGVSIIRTHDVQETRSAVRMFEAITARDK